MNIRDLTYLRAIARHKHFGRAAESCNVSQPTLSVQLKKLETDLGVTLIERTNRAAMLTPIGDRVLQLAGEALSAVDAIRSITAEAADPFSGRFRFGSIPTISPFLVPDVLRELGQAFPRLELVFKENITEQLTEDLLNGELDAAILATPPETPRLLALPLCTEPLLVIHPEGHLLKDLGELNIADLPLDQMILLSEGHCFRDQTVDLCNVKSQTTLAETSVMSLETIISLVAAGQGISIIPALAQSAGWLDRAQIGVKTLKTQGAARQLNLTFRKSSPRRKLIEAVTASVVSSVNNVLQE
jgi:LysR family hydrogen peroxide-inducible transcriptional activator